MCGICGVLHFGDKRPNLDILQQMVNSLHHRGPDGQGIHIEGSLGFGHSRLAIIDLSNAAGQPMSNEDGSIWITYNGEIYNFVEIRERLEKLGHVFRTKSDTEVIIHAYETWNVDCLAHLSGMFAFALWDSKRQQLWIVRDRLGIKPIFYLHRSDRLLFASEIKAILCDPTVERRVDLTALHHFLSLNYTPAPYTMFSGIRQLLPGHYLLVDSNGECMEKEYWDVSYTQKRVENEDALIEEFEDIFASTIKQHMISDVPLGAFLSGGVDSSAIVYWMSIQMPQPVQTFSIGFFEKTYNELDFARSIADSCKTDHHERIITPDTIEVLPRIVWHAEEPTADSSILPLYYLAKMAREKVTVALSGDGADEILAGYETYQAYYIAQLFQLIPGVIRHRIIRPLIDMIPPSPAKVSLDFKLKRFVRGAELDSDASHAYWRTIFDEETKANLYVPRVSQELNGTDTVELYRKVFSRTDAVHPLNRMLYVDTRFYLPNDMLVKVDRMTMAHSLEARVPYLDHKLVEFIASLPPNLKLKNWHQKKYLLKTALNRHLHTKAIWRRKQGFNVPKGIWLQNELRDYAYDHLSESRIQSMNLFQPKEVTSLLNDHIQNKRDNSHQIWGLLCFSLWWQQFVNQTMATP